MNLNKKMNEIYDKTPPLVIGIIALLVILLLPFTILAQNLGWKTVYILMTCLMLFVVIKFAFWVNKKSNLIKIEVS